jgi:hypothetical protein
LILSQAQSVFCTHYHLAYISAATTRACHMETELRQNLFS